jgi:hypothetical protein
MEGTTTEQSSTTVRPQFIYSCKSDQLLRANLLTGEQSWHQISAYNFKADCRWSELPGGSLLITGGDVSSEVVKIDTHREYAASSQPLMHTARHSHAAVYHSQYLYVLGGWDLRECERYSCAKSRWEVLPTMTVGGAFMSAVEVENSLYALGGYAGRGRDLDTVQKLSLDSLTWELMQLKLPQAVRWFNCFKTDTEVYLVIDKTLYSFTPLEVKAVKTLPKSVFCSSSYYSRGTLYYEYYGVIGSLALGI